MKRSGKNKMSAGNQRENSPPEDQDVLIVSARQVSLQICLERLKICRVQREADILKRCHERREKKRFLHSDTDFFVFP